MMKPLKSGVCCATLATLLLTCMPALAQSASPNVQILVHGIHFGGQVVYRYQVRNNSAATIHRVTLGVNDVGKDLPAIAWSQNPSLSDVLTEVPASQCKPFNNMRCSVAVYQWDYMPEPRAVILMRGIEATQSPPPTVFSEAHFIRPGTLSSIAEVYVPAANSGYLNGSGSVGFIDNFPRDTAGKPIVTAEILFTRNDTSPPSVSGSASVSKNRGMLDVKVNLSVSDNLDPAPAVILVSVTANEPLRANEVRAQTGTDSRFLQLKPNKDRVYYLTYRVTDGTGNSVSLVIEVPAAL